MEEGKKIKRSQAQGLGGGGGGGGRNVAEGGQREGRRAEGGQEGRGRLEEKKSRVPERPCREGKYGRGLVRTQHKLAHIMKLFQWTL